MSTRYSIAEQIIYAIESGWPESSDKVQIDDVIPAIGQKVNSMLRTEYFNVTLPSGETLPDNLSLATYENVAVTSLKNGRSKSVLPVMPISLPRNQGVYSIEDVDGLVSFIPLLATQRMLLKSQPLINDLLGQIGFEPKGRTVEYTKDLTLLDINAVNMQLAVFDIDTYSDTDLLPITSGMEADIILQLTQQFAGVEAADIKPTKK